jgi:ADP-ribosyl-[dinitrogen reductase] hydrolase
VRVEDLPTLTLHEDRRAETVLGLGTGAALGATYEFKRPEDVPEKSLEIMGGVFGWEPGEPTDDTEIALAVLEGYKEGSLDLSRVRDAMLLHEGKRSKGHREPDPEGA